jgi:hypothetical protein
MTPPKALTQRERIARLIRTTRLQTEEQSKFRKSRINKIKILFSPFAPADDHDLALADLVIKDLMNGRNSAR